VIIVSKFAVSRRAATPQALPHFYMSHQADDYANVEHAQTRFPAGGKHSQFPLLVLATKTRQITTAPLALRALLRVSRQLASRHREDELPARHTERTFKECVPLAYGSLTTFALVVAARLPGVRKNVTRR